MANKTQFFTNQLINIMPDSRPITSLSIVEDYEKWVEHFELFSHTENTKKMQILEFINSTIVYARVKCLGYNLYLCVLRVCREKMVQWPIKKFIWINVLPCEIWEQRILFHFNKFRVITRSWYVKYLIWTSWWFMISYLYL